MIHHDTSTFCLPAVDAPLLYFRIILNSWSFCFCSPAYNNKWMTTWAVKVGTDNTRVTTVNRTSTWSGSLLQGAWGAWNFCPDLPWISQNRPRSDWWGDHSWSCPCNQETTLPNSVNHRTAQPFMVLSTSEKKTWAGLQRKKGNQEKQLSFAYVSSRLVPVAQLRLPHLSNQCW